MSDYSDIISKENFLSLKRIDGAVMRIEHFKNNVPFRDIKIRYNSENNVRWIDIEYESGLIKTVEVGYENEEVKYIRKLNNLVT